MTPRIRTALQLARAHVWAVLLVLYPFTDQIIATVEGWMPALAKLLPANIYAFVGVVIVASKFALQALALVRSIKAARAAKEG